MDTIGKPPGPPWARWVRKQAEDDSEVVLDKSIIDEIAETLTVLITMIPLKMRKFKFQLTSSQMRPVQEKKEWDINNGS